MNVVELFDVRGKVALVTGGAQGLGRMIAEGFVSAGVRTYITSRKPEVAAAAAAEMCRHGECRALAADIAQPETAGELVRAIAATETGLHILVNNAGRTWGAPLEAFPDRAWPSVMAVNVQAPFTLVREFLPLLTAAARPGDPARVLNIGSLAGITAERLSAYSYSASKAALHHLTRLLAAELAGRHVAVNTVIPGYFPTQMTAHLRADEQQLRDLTARIPLGRLGTAPDIVGTCLFLASRAGAYLTGSELVVDGGLSRC